MSLQPPPERVGGRAVLAVTAIGSLATAACFYPGYLNGDSNWQYAQGVSGVYSDMHPVVMSWLMGRLDRVIEGTGGFFLLTTVGFWAALAFVLRQFSRGLRGFAIAATAIGASVPVFSMLSQTHKDLGMVVGLLAAFGLLVAAHRRRSLPALLAALPCLWYALAVRHNGVMSVLPFALWIAWLLARDHLPARAARRLEAPWRRVALGVGLVAALASSALFTSRLILGEAGRRLPYVQTVMAYDLVAISVRAGRSYVSDLYYPQRPLSQSELRFMYHPQTCYRLFWGRQARKVPVTYSLSGVGRIARTWLRALWQQPAAYVAHRVPLFLGHLGIGADTPWRKLEYPYHNAQDAGYDYRGPNVFEWPHARAVVSFFEWAHSTLLFRPWPYLLVGTLATGWAWRRPNRHRLEISLLTASSLCYIAPFLVVGVSSEFRYMWWPILAAMLQVVLTVEGRSS